MREKDNQKLGQGRTEEECEDDWKRREESKL